MVRVSWHSFGCLAVPSTHSPSYSRTPGFGFRWWWWWWRAVGGGAQSVVANTGAPSFCCVRPKRFPALQLAPIPRRRKYGIPGESMEAMRACVYLDAGQPATPKLVRGEYASRMTPKSCARTVTFTSTPVPAALPPCCAWCFPPSYILPTKNPRGALDVSCHKFRRFGELGVVKRTSTRLVGCMAWKMERWRRLRKV